LASERSSSSTSNNSETANDQLQKQRLRRKLRTQYRELIDTTSTQQEAITEADYGVFREALEKGDQLFSQVKLPREAALDTEFLMTVSQMGSSAVNSFSPGFTQYNFADFMRQLQSKLPDDDTLSIFDQLFALELQSQLFTFAPDEVNFMNGPLYKKIDEQVRKQRKKAQKDAPQAKAVTAEQLQQHTQEEETTRRVEHVYQWLEKRHSNTKDVKFWDFLADPDSFSKTVENIFHYAFLVKDGRTKLQDNLVIEPAAPPTEQDYNQSDIKVRQAVLTLTYEDWKSIVSREQSGTSSSGSHIPPYQPTTTNKNRTTQPLQSVVRNNSTSSRPSAQPIDDADDEPQLKRRKKDKT